MPKNFRVLRDRVLARPGAEERVEAERQALLIELGLTELRRAQQVSQVELASRLNITQGAVSKFEHADDIRLSTLRQYVEALGGHLELAARFEDRVVPLDLGTERETA